MMAELLVKDIPSQCNSKQGLGDEGWSTMVMVNKRHKEHIIRR